MSDDAYSDFVLPDHMQIGRGMPRLPLGTVYYIACQETQRLKIGFTSGDPMKRLKSLQTGAAGTLVMIAQHPGTRDDEAALHAHFNKQRLHGEWFEMSEEIFEHICGVVWNYAYYILKMEWPAPAWLGRGLSMIEMHVGTPLPAEIAHLAEKAPGVQ